MRRPDRRLRGRGGPRLVAASWPSPARARAVEAATVAAWKRCRSSGSGVTVPWTAELLAEIDQLLASGRSTGEAVGAAAIRRGGASRWRCSTSRRRHRPLRRQPGARRRVARRPSPARHRADRAQRRRQDHAVQRISGLQPPSVGPRPPRRHATSPGSARTSGPAAGLARTFQRLELFTMLSRARQHPGGRRHPHGLVRREGRRRPRRSTELIERVGLAEVADARVTALPTGQARLVELGRALACEPKVLLLDEPASGQDDSRDRALRGACCASSPPTGSPWCSSSTTCRSSCACATASTCSTSASSSPSGTPDEIQADDDGARGLPRAARRRRHEHHADLRRRPERRTGRRPRCSSCAACGPATAASTCCTASTCVVPAGQVVALLGPNGAGKTTTLRVIAGHARADRGRRAHRRAPGQRRPPDELARCGALPRSPRAGASSPTSRCARTSG